MNRGFVFRDIDRIIVVEFTEQEFTEQDTKYKGFELNEESSKLCYKDIPDDIATLCYIGRDNDGAIHIFNVGSISTGYRDSISDVVGDNDFMMCILDYFDENESKLIQKVMQ